VYEDVSWLGAAMDYHLRTNNRPRDVLWDELFVLPLCRQQRLHECLTAWVMLRALDTLRLLPD